MRWSFLLAILSEGVLFGMLPVVAPALAQAPASAEPPQPGVVMIKLHPPVYPPLAQQAQIKGDVKRQVFRKDGTVASVVVVGLVSSMLGPAAVLSAQKSTFECRACSEEVTSYTATYAFALRDRDCGSRQPRSGKCFYLWKCGASTLKPSPPVEIAPFQSHITVLAPSVCAEMEATH